MEYATACSGIGCAELAAEGLGWTQAWCSEIDAFASAVLAHRFPAVPNLGDMTALCERVCLGEVPAPDVLVAGTPCQAFSVAGNRRSLDDERGNLTLALVDLLGAVDDARYRAGLSRCALVWENVPGVLSVKDNAFGCFLGALVGAEGPVPAFGDKGRWPRAGLVRGPCRSAAWRILDAQWFGVAQRRRRLFVVAGAGDGFDPSAVLLEREGVQGNPRPRREAAQDLARPVASHTRGGGGWRNDVDTVDNLIPVTLRGISDYGDGLPSLRRKSGDCGGGSEVLLAYDGNNQSGPIEVATARNAHGGPHGRLDFETETFVVQCNGTNIGVGSTDEAAGTLRQGNQHVTGGTPVIVFDTTQISGAANHSSPKTGDPRHPFASLAHAPAIAFSSKDSGADAGALSPTLRAMNFTGSHANAGGQVAVAAQHFVVRRLMPVECERLQGLPDGFTNVPYRGKPAADGPRYRAIGNGMAVPVVRWILRRLDAHLKGEL